MSSLSIKYTGLDETISKFNYFLGDIQAFQIGEIVNYALAQIETEARSKAPVLTGALQKSIVHYMVNDLSGICEVGVPYAAIQEWGGVTPQGIHIAGKHYFTPAAMHGKQTFIDALGKYLKLAITGVKVTPPHAARGSRSSGGGGGSGTHKYLQKINTGAGFRYVYAKTTQTSKFHVRLRPGGKKSPTTKFSRRKPGGRR